jgi:hypothetical protein
MINLPRALRILAASATLGAGMLMVGAQAQVYVLESTADTVKAGTAFKTGERIAIPEGSTIRAVMPSGKTQTIKGPYSGLAEELAKGQQANESVIAWFKNLLQTGGSTERTPGVTRSMRAAEAPAPFSWKLVPTTVDSVMCVEKSAGLQLKRPSSQRAERLVVLNQTTAERGEAEFAAGSDQASWPASVPVRNDATYALLGADNRPRKQATLRVLDSLPGDDDILAVLATRECRYQFDAWVRDKVGAGKKGS